MSYLNSVKISLELLLTWKERAADLSSGKKKKKKS